MRALLVAFVLCALVASSVQLPPEIERQIDLVSEDLGGSVDDQATSIQTNDVLIDSWEDDEDETASSPSADLSDDDENDSISSSNDDEDVEETNNNEPAEESVENNEDDDEDDGINLSYLAKSFGLSHSDWRENNVDDDISTGDVPDPTKTISIIPGGILMANCTNRADCRKATRMPSYTCKKTARAALKTCLASNRAGYKECRADHTTAWKKCNDDRRVDFQSCSNNLFKKYAACRATGKSLDSCETKYFGGSAKKCECYSNVYHQCSADRKDAIKKCMSDRHDGAKKCMCDFNTQYTGCRTTAVIARAACGANPISCIYTTTPAPTTTTPAPTTTAAPTTAAPSTTEGVTTAAPSTTVAATTAAPSTTVAATTAAPSTTAAPTTAAPSTTAVAGTTGVASTTAAPVVEDDMEENDDDVEDDVAEDLEISSEELLDESDAQMDEDEVDALEAVAGDDDETTKSKSKCEHKAQRDFKNCRTMAMDAHSNCRITARAHKKACDSDMDYELCKKTIHEKVYECRKKALQPVRDCAKDAGSDADKLKKCADDANNTGSCDCLKDALSGCQKAHLKNRVKCSNQFEDEKSSCRCSSSNHLNRCIAILDYTKRTCQQ